MRGHDGNTTDEETRTFPDQQYPTGPHLRQLRQPNERNTSSSIKLKLHEITYY